LILYPFLIGYFFLGQWVCKMIYKKYPFKSKSEKRSDIG